jgi:hypothetical protein
MRALEKILNKLDGYLLSIKRNPDIGMYELEVGIPKNWVYKDTNKIECEVIHETEKGSLIKITPTVEGVVIDDLIDFVDVIIDTNQELNRMQQEFDEQMAKTKKDLEEQVQSFYDKLEGVKKHSFESIDEQIKRARRNKKKMEEEEVDVENEDTLKEEVENKLSH